VNVGTESRTGGVQRQRHPQLYALPEDQSPDLEKVGQIPLQLSLNAVAVIGGRSQCI
jgi:hypothetical protein